MVTQVRYKTNEEFVDACEVKHLGRYTYENTMYTGSHNKIIVTCKEHGDYECMAYSHVAGSGVCPKCSKTTRLTQEEFERRGNEAHNFKYDYTKAKYTNKNTKVMIICPVHGEFEQTPHSHMSGSGCPRCSDTTKDTETFIKESRSLFGDLYDYDRVDYKNNCTKIILTCRQHGDFSIDPSMHLSHKAGCPKCFGRYKTNDEFVAELIKVRGEEYDYSLVDYQGSLSYIKIICRTHGVFTQKATNHLHNLNGCPECKRGGFDPRLVSQLYIYEFDDFIGYGITSKPKTRHYSHTRTFEKYNISPNLIHCFYASGEDCKQVELEIRRTFNRVASKVEGFIFENTTKENLPEILDLLKEYGV